MMVTITIEQNLEVGPTSRYLKNTAFKNKQSELGLIKCKTIPLDSRGFK